MKLKLRVIPGWNLMEYALARAAAWLLNRLPAAAVSGLAAFSGRVLYAVSSKRRKTALANLDLVFGERLSAKRKKEIAVKSLECLALSLFDFFRIPSVIPKVKEVFEVRGKEHFDLAFAKGKGVIGVVSHLGSWEYLAFLAMLGGYPFSVVVRDIKNPLIHAWVRDLRRQMTLNAIDRKSSIREVLRELKRNHYVAILIDQWAGHEGLWLDFFGHPTSTTSIPARLAARTGAALVPMACLHKGPGEFLIEVLPEAPLIEGERGEEETTLALNKTLEQFILKYPEQWIWSHRRWKDKWRHIRGL